MEDGRVQSPVYQDFVRGEPSVVTLTCPPVTTEPPDETNSEICSKKSRVGVQTKKWKGCLTHSVNYRTLFRERRIWSISSKTRDAHSGLTMLVINVFFQTLRDFGVNGN